MTQTASSTRGVVAAPHWLAAETGRAVLAEGGNACEAMVAMLASVAVVYPHMSTLGGDAFWLVREPDGRVFHIEACGGAGSGASIAAYRKHGYDVLPARGAHAALTVAGTVGGWSRALELARAAGGRLPLDVLLHDAIGHARNGFAVARCQADVSVKLPDALREAPGFADHFLRDGNFLKEGDPLVQPALAATLEQLAYAGLDDFYRGDVAREIAVDLERIKSPVTRDDLRRYEARFTRPLEAKLKSVRLWNSPPPTQGLASLLILGIAERLDLGHPDSTAFVHGLVEATKRAFRIRDRVVTDPRQMDEKPADFLTSEVFEREAARISTNRAAPWPAMPEDEGDTVWLGAIDGQGRAVSAIQSIYWEWGSGCVLPATGILWQNRGAAFSLDERARNPLQPGRLPFHTLNPPIAVTSDGRVISYGTMGGDGQPQTQAAVLVRALMGLSVGEAVAAPRWRLGRTWGETETTLKIEPRFDDSVFRALSQRGHAVELVSKPFSTEMGQAGLIIRHPDGRIEGTHDPRADGGALGV